MNFAEKYVAAVNSSNLQDDAYHHQTEALIAAALADTSGGGLGALLSRVKYSDGTINKQFEGNPANLVRLLRIWHEAVKLKGVERRWIKSNTAWDQQAAHALYERVAYASLAHWLDGKCKACGGAGQTPERRLCTTCKGSGQAELPAGGFEREKTLDMVSELEGLMQAHNSRASNRLRRHSGCS
jgi:hypothetical protein